MLERSDRIALIVAALLVVVLAGGGAALLWKRADTLSRERTVADADVKLTPLQSPEIVPAASEETEPPAPRPTTPEPPAGGELGYVKRIKVSGGAFSLTYDPAALLKGQEADLYAKQHGMAAAPAGWLVANDTHKLKTAKLASDAVIVVASPDGSIGSTMTPDAFRKAVLVDAADPALENAAFWFVRDGARISRIEQLPAE